jgi:hypothetical protein
MPNEQQEQTQETTVTEDLDAFTNEFFGRNPPQEPKAETTAEQTEEVTAEQDQDEEATEPEAAQEDDEVEGTNDQDVDAGGDGVDEPANSSKAKPTVQDRINELVRQREEAKRDAASQLEALRREFEEKLAALKPAEPKVEPKGEPTPDDLNEDGTPKYDLGEFDPQYIRDLTKFTLEQEKLASKAQAAEEVKAQQEREAYDKLTTEWNQKVEATVAENPDFMEKGQKLLDGFKDLDGSYATYLSTLLMSMDKGPEVLYYLSNNPAEAVTIVNSGAQKATLALGRIEAKFLEAAATKTLAKPKVSKAPPPAPPAARSRGSNGAFVGVSPDTDDLDAFAGEFFKRK